MLAIRDLDAFYGRAQILHGVSLDVASGEILCLLGRNGAGKTTLLKAIMGLVSARGSVRLGGDEAIGLPPHRIPRLGVGYAPQGRRLFAELTVAENLEVGLMARGGGAAVRRRMLEMFPRLGERLDQAAGSLSGGEQQMLAMARALCLSPSVMLLDEPTEGLQPSMIALVRESVARLRGEGVAVLLVEQGADAALALADRVAFLENGVLRETAPASELRGRREVFDRYLGLTTRD